MQTFANLVNALDTPSAIADLGGRILVHNPAFATHVAAANVALIGLVI